MDHTLPQQPVPGAADGLELRPLRPTHLSATADLHVRQLPNGFFPSLGTHFIGRWHRTFIDARQADAAVVVDPSRSDEVVGYLLLVLDPQSQFQHVRSEHGPPLMMLGLLGLVRRPRLAAYFVRTRARRYITRLMPRRGDGPRAAVGAKAPAVVHAVVTRPGHHGRGVAKLLLTWAESRAARAGATELALVTDVGETCGALSQDTSQGAAGMYDHLGWQRVARHERDGRTLVEFRMMVTRERDGGPAHR